MDSNEQFLFRYKDSGNYQRFSLKAWEILGGEKSGWVREEETKIETGEKQPLGQIKDLSEISRVSQGKKPEPEKLEAESEPEPEKVTEPETPVLPISGAPLEPTIPVQPIAVVEPPKVTEPAKAVKAEGKKPKVVEVKDLK